jgi:hypothetical protein
LRHPTAPFSNVSLTSNNKQQNVDLRETFKLSSTNSYKIIQPAALSTASKLYEFRTTGQVDARDQPIFSNTYLGFLILIKTDCRVIANNRGLKQSWRADTFEHDFIAGHTGRAGKTKNCNSSPPRTDLAFVGVSTKYYVLTLTARTMPAKR